MSKCTSDRLFRYVFPSWTAVSLRFADSTRTLLILVRHGIRAEPGTAGRAVVGSVLAAVHYGTLYGSKLLQAGFGATERSSFYTNLTSKFLSDFVSQHTNSQQLLVLSGRPVAQYGQQAQPFSCKSPPSPSHVNPSAGTCNKPYTVYNKSTTVYNTVYTVRVFL